MRGALTAACEATHPTARGGGRGGGDCSRPASKRLLITMTKWMRRCVAGRVRGKHSTLAASARMSRGEVAELAALNGSLARRLDVASGRTLLLEGELAQAVALAVNLRAALYQERQRRERAEREIRGMRESSDEVYERIRREMLHTARCETCAACAAWEQRAGAAEQAASAAAGDAARAEQRAHEAQQKLDVEAQRRAEAVRRARAAEAGAADSERRRQVHAAHSELLAREKQRMRAKLARAERERVQGRERHEHERQQEVQEQQERLRRQEAHQECAQQSVHSSPSSSREAHDGSMAAELADSLLGGLEELAVASSARAAALAARERLARAVSPGSPAEARRRTRHQAVAIAAGDD